MKFDFRTTVLLLLLSTFVATSSAQSLDYLIEEPEVAQSFDYCTWYYDNGGNDADLSTIEGLLKQDDDRTETELASAVLISAGAQIAKLSKNKKSCSKHFVRGVRAYDGLYKKARKKLEKRSKFEESGDEKIAEVQRTITAIWVDDQAGRQAYIKSQTTDTSGSQYWTRKLAIGRLTLIDRDATKYIRKTLDDYDWIDNDRFGIDVSNHAWILVQHADDNPEFQALVLERMKPYIDTGGNAKKNYAYLFDRVAVNTGKLQLYGTQPTWDCTDTGLVLAPLEDPDNVNARRAEFGMGDVQESLAQMSKTVCGK